MRFALTLVVAAAAFWVAFDGGSYSLESRALLGIVVLWGTLLAFALGLWPLRRPPPVALLAGGLLVAFALVTGLSIAWAESAERALVELNRTVLLTAVFAVAVLAGTRGNLGRWLDGLALGIAAVGVLALAGRLFPDVFPASAVQEFIPAVGSRLSWPVEYWNGLAIFVALGLPLLLRVATTGHPLARGAAVGVLPALAATLFLTSSRSGFALALLGAVLFFVLAPRRWGTAAAGVVGAAGSVAAIAILDARDELVNMPEAEAAVGQGRSAALLVLLVCLVTGTLFAAGSAVLAGRRTPPLPAWAAALAVLVVAAVAAVALDAAERFRGFCDEPTEFGRDDFVQSHLVSGTGSGRCQFWSAALDQWREAPLVGQGAGSYEAWWSQHGTIPYFIRDAHSLYLETLGELGLVGFVLVVGALATGLVAGVRRLLGAADADEAAAIAAVLAGFSAFLAAAALDWMWEETAVAVVGLVLLGLAVGPATSTARPALARAAEPGPRSPLRRYGGAVAILLVGWALLCVQAVPLLTQYTLVASQDALRANELTEALEQALAARQLSPWAASPYLQLALVHESRNDLPAARAAIGDAIERDPLNWRLWLVAARLETLDGDVAAGRRSLARAVELNPRSPLFANAN